MYDVGAAVVGPGRGHVGHGRDARRPAHVARLDHLPVGGRPRPSRSRPDRLHGRRVDGLRPRAATAVGAGRSQRHVGSPGQCRRGRCATGLQYVLLRSRIRPMIAVTAAPRWVPARCLLLVASSAFSETPYIGCRWRVLVVLLPRSTTARCAAAGPLAGLGFLTAVCGRQPDRHRCRRDPDRLAEARGPSAARCSSRTWRRPVAGGVVGRAQPRGQRAAARTAFEAVRSDRWDVLLRWRSPRSVTHCSAIRWTSIRPRPSAPVAVVVIVVAGLLWQYRARSTRCAPAC